jgi:23S rRNA (cytosine1962-C5)-methyltransferase
MPSVLQEIRLKVRVHGRHPWFYRKMVEKPQDRLPAGGPVRVVDKSDRFVGIGFYNPRTELALRMLSREEVTDVDAFLGELLARACDLREQTLRLPAVTNAYRLVHAEGDGFPGLVLDRLGDTIVGQIFSLAVQKRIETIGERLVERYRGTRLALTVDETALEREGLERVPYLEPHETEVHEHGIRYLVRPGHGHKTGFFADQRDNRLWLATFARGRRVLDLCCHAGGFALAAAKGGARSVVAIDLDEEAVAQTKANAGRNRLGVDARHEDAFDALRAAARGAHDLIVLDPPKWVAGRKDIETGIVRYRDLNRQALEKLEAGGLLVTCSCSGAVSEDTFLAMLRTAAADARRDLRILAVRGAGPDHPVGLECPETRYLKVVFAEVR